MIIGNCSKFIIIPYYFGLLVKLLFAINFTAVNAVVAVNTVAVTTLYVDVAVAAAVTAVDAVSVATVVAVSAATVVAVSVVFSLSSARRMLLKSFVSVCCFCRIP